LSESLIENKYIHLTNNAVQKYSTKYGQFENGNQLSFPDFEKYLPSNHPRGNMKKHLIPSMKQIITHSLSSVKQKLNLNNRKLCFEIFGYDFMIDSDFAVWLIEVNTNPCIEESSPLLKALIPRMLDNAFTLTIDKIFPLLPKQKCEDNTVFEDLRVDGYSNDQNLWELLGNLSSSFNKSVFKKS